MPKFGTDKCISYKICSALLLFLLSNTWVCFSAGHWDIWVTECFAHSGTPRGKVHLIDADGYVLHVQQSYNLSQQIEYAIPNMELVKVFH